MTFIGTVGTGSRFAFCIDFVLQHETEYHADGSVKVEHDPHDPGGTTKYGIDQRSHPNVDIENLTLDQAKEIYYEGEWTRCRCPQLKPPWDLALFDAAVNVGSHRAIMWVQRSVNVTVDGFIGPKTIAAVNDGNSDEFADFIALRQDYYTTQVRTSLRIRYLKGWLARVDDLRDASKIDTSRLA